MNAPFNIPVHAVRLDEDLPVTSWRASGADLQIDRPDGQGTVPVQLGIEEVNQLLLLRVALTPARTYVVALGELVHGIVQHDARHQGTGSAAFRVSEPAE